MIINEFLPNPAGKDTDGEWIEFFNNGSAPVNLRGWVVKDASGKNFKFAKEVLVEPGGYFKLDYSQSKISLNNAGEKLFLYDASGKLADKAEYSGSAPEGNSLARRGDAFVFTESPTPGSANVFSAKKNAESSAPKDILEENIDYSEASVLSSGREFSVPVLFICFFIAFILSAVFIYVLNNINDEADIDQSLSGKPSF
jgi:hypothetical protein